MTAQGYSRTEIARELGISNQQVRRLAERVARRIPADNAKHWRELQLLEYERLKRALEGVLEANHVVVSNGHIVHQYAVDDEGKPIWDPVYGPGGEQLTDDEGNLRVEQRKIPLRDNGVVMEAAAELRKINAEVTKLLGLAIQPKQTVEVQHVNYTITGVDMGKVLGTTPAGE